MQARLALFLADDENDARLPRTLATQSWLPQRTRRNGQVMTARELPTSISPAGTSLLLSGNSNQSVLTHSGSPVSRLASPSMPSNAERSSARPKTPMSQPQGPALLECPFNFLYCFKRFPNFSEWLCHSLEHFGEGISPPRNNRCVFCKKTFEDVGMASWHAKLVCTQRHHEHGHKLRDGSQDHALHQYLWENKVLTNAEWKGLVQRRTKNERESTAPTSPPESPGSEEPEQEMMVMTSNRRRERTIERRDRRRRQLEDNHAR